MDRWKYFAITHHDHVICNPTSSPKLEEMLELVALSQDARVLDIACGKGEFLIRLIERYVCSGVGVDLSPYFVGEARRRAVQRLSHTSIDLQEIDGAQFDGEPESFDLTICLGASWIWNGHQGTLRALMQWTKPEGLIVVGEPFWQRDPDDAYLAAGSLLRGTFGTHFQNVQTGLELGLTLLYTIVSNGDEWDHYESLQWRAAESWADLNTNDPDRDIVLMRCRDATRWMPGRKSA